MFVKLINRIHSWIFTSITHVRKVYQHAGDWQPKTILHIVDKNALLILRYLQTSVNYFAITEFFLSPLYNSAPCDIQSLNRDIRKWAISLFVLKRDLLTRWNTKHKEYEENYIFYSGSENYLFLIVF